MTSSLGGSDSLAVSPDDPCGQERATFAKSNDFFTADVVKSAGIGALLGGVGGAAIGGAIGGGHGAMIGGLLGIFTGTVTSLTVSYTQYMQQHYNGDPSGMVSGINSDLAVESRARDQTIINFRNLSACRFAQASLIRREASLGQISHDEAEHELTLERGWFDQEIAVAQHWGVNMEKRDEQFQAATSELEKKAPPRGRSRHDPTRRAIVTATETNPDKREALESEVGTAQRESQVAFNLNTQSFNLIWYILYA